MITYRYEFHRSLTHHFPLFYNRQILTVLCRNILMRFESLLFTGVTKLTSMGMNNDRKNLLSNI